VLKFTKSWRKSKDPSKQRNYIRRAPLHLRHKMVASHLSRELREKYKKRSFPVRKGDKIIIKRGQFKGLKGKVEKVLLNKLRVHVDVAKISKKDGTLVFYPVHPSNLEIIELNLDDKKREKVLKRGSK